MKARRRIWFLLIMLAVILSAVTLVAMPEEVLAGYSSVNGLVSATYISKHELVVATIVGPSVYGFLWELAARRNERKVQKYPHLQSYRVRSALICILGTVCTAAAVVANVVVLIMNM